MRSYKDMERFLQKVILQSYHHQSSRLSLTIFMNGGEDEHEPTRVARESSCTQQNIQEVICH
jgi:hypothetical protein